MIFDKFCAVVERHLPEFRYLADNAKIFVFNQAAHTIKPGDTSVEDFETFVLPFPCTVIEDPATAVVLVDTEEEQVGVKGMRKFIDIAPVVKWNDDAFSADEALTPEEREAHRRMLEARGISQDAVVITIGDIADGFPSDKGIGFRSCANRVIVASKDAVYGDRRITQSTTPDNVAFEMAQAGVRNVLAAIEELCRIYSRRHFVLETSPINPKTHPKRIARTHQRPLYTILDARSIREKMGTLGAHEKALAEGRKRNSPIPHERRRHKRRLSTEGGHYKENKVVIIPAVWIGQSEAKVGNKIYKVRLDI